MATLITPTGRRIFKVWWSFWWRSMLFVLIAGFPASFLFTLLPFRLAYIIGMLIGMYIIFSVLKWVLTRKLYSDFTIALIEKERVIEAFKSFSEPTMIKKGRIFFWGRREGKYLNEEEYLEKFEERSNI